MGYVTLGDTASDTYGFRGKVAADSGIKTKESTDNVTTPTEAELITAFGTAATNGAGFIAIVDDNGAGTASQLVWTTGSGKYFFVAGTLAA